MDPRVIYDRETRVLSIELEQGEIAGTTEFDENHLVDLDSAGRVLSIEVLSPDDLKLEEMAERFGLEERLSAILKLVNAVLEPSTQTGIAAYDLPSSGITVGGIVQAGAPESRAIGSANRPNLPATELVLD